MDLDVVLRSRIQKRPGSRKQIRVKTSLNSIKDQNVNDFPPLPKKYRNNIFVNSIN